MNPINLGLAMIFHPSDAFVIIKRRYKDISVWSAVVIYLLMIVIRYLTILLTHRPLQPMDISDTDLLLQIAVLVVPPITYAVSVYGVTCVMHGETEFRCIFITTAYCFVPYLIINPLNILLSRVLTVEEAGLYYGIAAIATIWILLLLFAALMLMNTYSFSKALYVAFLSIIGIVLIWFVLLLAFAFTFQIVMFLRELLQELQIISIYKGG